MSDGRAIAVRLNVNLNRETADMLKSLSDERGLSLTEVVRRAISVYAFVDSEWRQGNRIEIEDRRGKRREVVLL